MRPPEIKKEHAHGSALTPDPIWVKSPFGLHTLKGKRQLTAPIHVLAWQWLVAVLACNHAERAERFGGRRHPEG